MKITNYDWTVLLAILGATTLAAGFAATTLWLLRMSGICA